jgi:hypothetical protein
LFPPEFPVFFNLSIVRRISNYFLHARSTFLTAKLVKLLLKFIPQSEQAMPLQFYLYA